jgi:hypothetical protein
MLKLAAFAATLDGGDLARIVDWWKPKKEQSLMILNEVRPWLAAGSRC